MILLGNLLEFEPFIQKGWAYKAKSIMIFTECLENNHGVSKNPNCNAYGDKS